MIILHSLRVRLLLTMSLVVLVAMGAVAFFTSRSTRDQFQMYVRTDMERDQRVVSELLSQYKGDSSPESLQALVENLAGTSSERIVVADGEGKILADSAHTLIGETLQLPVPMRTNFTGGVSAAGGNAEYHVVSDQGGISVSGPVTAPFTATIISGTAGDGGKFFTMPVTGSVGYSWAPIFIPLATVPLSGTSLMRDAMTSASVVGSAGVITNVTSFPGADLIVARLPDANGTPTEVGFVNSVNQQLLLAALAAGAVALLLTWLLSRRIVGPIEALTAAAGRMERGDLGSRVEVKSRDEIGKLAHAFNSMSSSIAQQEQLRRNMVTDIAHELRTPLSNIQGYLEAVRDGVVEADPALIGSLHEESLILSRLVEDLQELQLAEAGQLKIERGPARISEIVGRVRRSLNQTAEAKEITIGTDIPGDLPAVQVDSARIGQVLRNLLENAITHTPAGGEVRITASAANGEIEVKVADTGVGIAPDHLPHIFDRFYRADASRARSTGGAGLGLAIVRQLVELHGGRVWAESTPGEGATFFFTLPYADDLP